MKETRKKRERRRGTNINHQRFDLSIASISSFGGAINVALELPPALALPFLTCRLSGTANLGSEESVVDFVSEVMLNCYKGEAEGGREGERTELQWRSTAIRPPIEPTCGRTFPSSHTNQAQRSQTSPHLLKLG